MIPARGSVRLRAMAILLSLVVVSPSAAGTVWTIGPGEDFANLTAAVAGAQSGDVLLIRTPSPGVLDLTAKSLTIITDLATPPDLRHPLADQLGNDMNFVPIQNRVAAIPAGGRVVLRGLRLYGLEVDAIAGSVWVEDCEVYGMAPAMWVKNAASVNVVGCELQGPAAFHDVLQLLPTLTRGSALVAVNAWMSIDHSSLTGGQAIDALWCPTSGQVVGGSNGGNGAILTGGALYATGTSFGGADGGQGLVDPNGGCTPGGDGGNGLWLKGNANAWHLDCAFAPGVGKPGFADDPSGSGCVPDVGANGLSVLVEPGSNRVAVNASARGFTIASPVTPPQVVSLVFEGQAGDVALLTFATTLSTDILPALKGVYLLKFAGPVVTAGVLPVSGPHAVPVAIPALPAGVDEASITVQAAFCPTTGGCCLGPGTRLTLLAPGL